VEPWEKPQFGKSSSKILMTQQMESF